MHTPLNSVFNAIIIIADINKEIQKPSSSIEILPNFFKSDFFGRLHEFFYVYFGSVLMILKLFNSILKKK